MIVSGVNKLLTSWFANEFRQVREMLNKQIDFLPDRSSHWCHRSQKYAGVDNLIHLIEEGWKLKQFALLEKVWINGRRSLIYHFFVYKHSKSMQVRVIDNPYVTRVIRRFDIRLTSFTKRQSSQSIVKV